MLQHRTCQQQKGSKAAANRAAAEGSATQQVKGQQQCKNRENLMDKQAGSFILSEAYLHGNNCSLHLPVGMLSLHKQPQAEPPQGWTPHW